MAAFAQLAVVRRGSNTCVYVIAIFTMCESTEQRICIKFCFKIGKKKTQRKRINYCSKHTVKMQWVVHKCLTGSVDLKRVEPLLKATLAKQRSCYWRFLIMRISYITSTLPMGKHLTRNSTWRSCNVCVNRFAENDRKNGGMVTGSCTTTMRLHTLHILCSSFWPNTAPLSCSSSHTHQISHRVTFSYSQGLRSSDRTPI